jgi:ParB family transcriptional regulator, chromosome partitioning protein
MAKKSHNPMEVDLSGLDLRYAHTRVAKPKHVDMIANSIDRFGQITPVLIIPHDELLVLIHGFVRMAAMRKLGRDPILADIQEVSEAQALFRLLVDTEQRQWEAVEQAWIIRDLKERLGCVFGKVKGTH